MIIIELHDISIKYNLVVYLLIKCYFSSSKISIIKILISNINHNISTIIYNTILYFFV